MTKVLITDGVNKNALAILRAIGNKYRIDITTNYPKIITLCAFSRFCGKVHRLKSDMRDPDSYAIELLELLKLENYDVLIPVSLKSYLAVVKHKKEFEKLTNLVVPNWEQMEIAYNKDITMEFAKNLNVPIPDTINLNSISDLKKIQRFPVVIKSSDDSGSFVKYCNNREELNRNFRQLNLKSKTQIISQAYIDGFGCGFYGVYSKGKLVAHFMHRRIKEFPITGGPSAVAESYFDEKLYGYGKKICDELEWNGPIMVEFKYDRENNDYSLIEINPKLWGSLDLTVEAGVNVPDILVELALHGKTETRFTYEAIRYRWLFPDEFWVLMSNLSIQNLRDFFNMEKNCKTNFYLEDPVPFMFQFLRSIVDSIKLLFVSSNKFPHGKLNK